MCLRLLCAWLVGAQADHGLTTLSSRQALVNTMVENNLQIQEHGGSVSRSSTGLHHLSAMLVAINSTADAIDYSAMDDGDAIINISGSVLLIQRGHLFQSTAEVTFQRTSQGSPADAPPELPAFPSGAGLAEPRGIHQNASSLYSQKQFYYTLPMELLAESIPPVSTSTIIVSVISILVVFLAICWGCGSSSYSPSGEPSVTAPPPFSGYTRSQTKPTATPAPLSSAPNAIAQIQPRPRRQKYRGDGNTQAFCRELIAPEGSNFKFNGKILPYQQEEVFEIRHDGVKQAGHEAVLKCMMSETRGHCGILLETLMGSSVVYLMTDEAVSPKGEHLPQQDRHVALVRMNNRDLPADPLPTAVVEQMNGKNNLCVRWCTPSGQPGDVFVSMIVHTNHGIDLRNKEGSLVASLKGQLGEHGMLHVAKGMDLALVVSAMIAAYKLQ